MKKATNLFLVLVLSILCSCKHSLRPADYVRYVRDERNGLNKVVQVNGWEYSILYKPYDYIIATENRGVAIDSNVQKRKIP